MAPARFPKSVVCLPSPENDGLEVACGGDGHRRGDESDHHGDDDHSRRLQSEMREELSPHGNLGGAG